MRPVRYLSVCSGIEAASAAWETLGWEPLAFSEIDAAPRAVLQHHFPHVPLHGDFTKLRDEPWIADADLLVGGTPCQAFSVAGLRRSLDDDRGNLSLEFVRLADAIDHLRRAAGRAGLTVVWENVPGVLSTPDNAFGCFLAALVGADAPLVPGRGQRWTDAGLVAGPQRAAAWRILDAQYFHLAQRRERVFVVACPRDGADPSEILFEPEGVRRHSPPRREAGEGTSAAVAPSLTGSGRGVERPGESRGQDPIVADSVAGTLNANGKAAGSATQQDAETGMLIPIQNATRGKDQNGLGIGGDVMFTLDQGSQHAIAGPAYAFGGNDTRGAIDVSTALRAKGGTGHGDFESETFVVGPAVSVDLQNCLLGGDLAGTLDTSRPTRGGGQAVAIPILESGKRTGRSSTDTKAGDGIGEPGDPMFTLGADSRHAIAFDTTQITSTTNRSQPEPGKPCHTLNGEAHPPAIAFQTRGSNIDTGQEVTGTLGSNADRASGSAPCIAFTCKDYGGDAGDLSPTLRAMEFDGSHANGGGQVAVAFPLDIRNASRSDGATGVGTPGTGVGNDGDPMGTLSAGAVPAVAFGHNGGPALDDEPRWAVRRLTPTECERLQGFPDGWTLVPNAKGQPMADGPRYRMIGNSMARNVMAWLGRRIDAALRSR